MTKNRQADLEARRARVHMPRTTFYERVLPVVFVGIGVILLVIIVIAVGVLLGITPWH